jgi:MFS family permease
MDAFSQGVHVTNQAVIYELVAGGRARVTTIYMTTYFVGGALGTATGTAAYARYGWVGACATAAGFCGIAGLAWLAARRRERPERVRTEVRHRSAAR